VPLLHIKNLIEQSAHQRDERVLALASRALRTIDAYEYAQDQTVFALEPVSVGSVMYDAAHQLYAYAQQYNYDIVIDSKGRQGAVMAEPRALQLLLELVGEVLVTLPAEVRRPQILLGARRVQGDVVAGVFRAGQRLNLAPRRTNGLSPHAGQLDASLGIAELLAAKLDTALRPYSHNRLPGIGARFVQSSQLRLI
jgi:hypothetical protein